MDSQDRAKLVRELNSKHPHLCATSDGERIRVVVPAHKLERLDSWLSEKDNLEILEEKGKTIYLGEKQMVEA